MSPTELNTSTPAWKSLEGTVLEGGYELREILEAEENSASLRVRVLGDYSQNAFAKFFVAAGDVERDQIAIWETLRSLGDDKLNAPAGAGVVMVGDIAAEYVVLPVPDETLAGVLEERALTEDEAAQLMTSLVNSLEALHASGFVHGRLAPAEVVSTGAAIQVSTVWARRINTLPALNFAPGRYLAPESVEQNTTTAADVWCLGATLLEALKRTSYTINMEIAALQLSPGFERVIGRCLSADPHERCVLAEIPELYRRAPQPAQPAPISPGVSGEKSEVAGEPKPVAMAAVAAAGDVRVPAPPIESPALPAAEAGTEPHTAGTYDGPILVQPSRAAAESAATRGIPKSWLFGGIAVVLLLFAFLIFGSGRHAVKQPAVTRGSTAPAAASTPQTDWPTRTLAPDKTGKNERAAINKSVRPAPVQTRADGSVHGSVWRVVLYTYAREGDAQKKAQSLNDRHVHLGAEVFSPNGGSPYLVVAGGKMTHDEAVRMRTNALRMGMPHDSYIQNYNQ
ncbi:MAG: protein kinase [Acidobacteriaceae bacterium]|nr:protein kinase [Acidobacteriaceae bacterium]